MKQESTSNLVMLGLCCLSYAFSPADGVELVRGGKPVATVVLPENTEWDRYVNAGAEELEAFARQRFPKASAEELAKVVAALPKLRQAEAKRAGDDEKLAAEELVEFIQRMTGASLKIVRQRPDDKLPAGNCVLLGRAFAEHHGHGADINALGPHGFVIRRADKRVVIAGRAARGTLYGVYELLESFGCRWVMPGPFGEIIPTHRNLVVTKDVTQSPSHPLQRHWWCTGSQGDGYIRWTLRNKGAAHYALGQSKIHHAHWSDRPLKWGAKGDRGRLGRKLVPDYKRDAKGQIIRNRDGAPAERIMVEREVRRLPDEYYALVAGEPDLHFANMGNPDAWQLYADYYKQEFYKKPLWDYLSISAADGLIIDDRKSVRALDSGEWDWTQGARTATDRLWFFHRRYLDMVMEEHPDRKYGVLVYANNMSPPRIETVHPSMALVLAPLNVSPLHHVRDDKCKTNRIYRKWLPAWFKQAEAVGAESHYYDYFPIGFSWSNFVIAPQWQIIGRNYPWFHEMGLDGHMTQGFDDWGSMGLTHWVAVRLYWDVTQDYNKLVEEYCQLRFGKAAASAMHAYYRVFEHRMDRIPNLCGNEIWGTHLAIDAATRAKGREWLKKAAPLVTDDREKRHFDTVVKFQQAMDAWCDGIDHARETGDFAAAAQQMKLAFEIRGELNEIYSHFINPFQTDPDPSRVRNLRRYRSSGWYNKYLLWADVIAKSGASLTLPRNLHIALDTDNVAWAEGLHKPSISVANLEEWDSTQVPDIKYQSQREPAAFFYRTSIDVPASFGTHKSMSLFFPSIIARTLQIWINGEAVMFEADGYQTPIWRGPATFWENYNHSRMFDVTSHIKPGAKNTIAFRVFKSYDHGGTYDRVFLLADPADMK